MTDDRLRGLSFTMPALKLGVADIEPDGRYACAVLLGPGADRIGDDALEYDVAGVDLSAVRAGRCPLLVEHRFHLDYIVGGVADAWIEGGALKAVVRFARGGEGERVWELLSQGFPAAVSIGAEVVSTQAKGRTPDGGTIYTVSRWKLTEVSIVARPQRREAHLIHINREGLQSILDRMPAAEDAARQEVRQRLQLDRWDRWALTAGVRLAKEFDLDMHRFGEALAREVADHAAVLKRELGAPILLGAGCDSV